MKLMSTLKQKFANEVPLSKQYVYESLEIKLPFLLKSTINWKSQISGVNLFDFCSSNILFSQLLIESLIPVPGFLLTFHVSKH